MDRNFKIESFCLPEKSAKLALEWFMRHPNQDKHKPQQAIKTLKSLIFHF